MKTGAEVGDHKRVKQKRKVSKNRDFLLWRKPFRFQTTRDIEACLLTLQRMDDTSLNHVAVHVDTEEELYRQDGILNFCIESRGGSIKGWVFGTIQDDNGTIINGAAGIDPDVMFIFLAILIGMPIIYLSLSAHTARNLIYLVIFGGLIVIAIRAGCLMTRDALINGLEDQILRGDEE